MSVIDLIFEANDRWVLAEPLAYDLYHRAGVAACRTDFVRLTVDGQPAGYFLLIEQVNKAFLRHNGLRDDGNLYKADWVGNGLVGQHEKHINRHTGHDDLIKLVDQLEQTKNQTDEQWAIIKREFDLEQVLTHYAVRMLISDWDGFFNNYWLYHDLHGTKKWTFYPWDEDKTWGEYDGWEQGGTLYNLPLSYASEGDHPPGEPGGRPSTSYGFQQWWRAGGFISRPLLANATFRKAFLARLKELLNTEFTEAQLFPLVDGYRDRLQEEVTYRAEALKEDPQRAQKRFEANLDSLKEFIKKRRQWLLEQEEIRSAGTAGKG
jgi:spore coat protein H